MKTSRRSFIVFATAAVAIPYSAIQTVSSRQSAQATAPPADAANPGDDYSAIVGLL